MAIRNVNEGVTRVIGRGDAVLVVGLGRFGSALAETLVELGHEVLGVDVDPRSVQKLAPTLTHVVEADMTDPEVCAQIGAGDFKVAVVGIGNDVEASILTTSVLADMGVESIWAKAITRRHGEILQRVGAHHVTYPEHDAGHQVAHLVTGRMLGYIEVDPGFALVETKAPREIVGSTLADAQLRAKYNVTVVCVKPEGEPFTYATADTCVGPGDLLLVAGATDCVERFADAT
jgi:trk system potassium uptake protein TrkA